MFAANQIFNLILTLTCSTQIFGNLFVKLLFEFIKAIL
jgi:hypothetical protein